MHQTSDWLLEIRAVTRKLPGPPEAIQLYDKVNAATKQQDEQSLDTLGKFLVEFEKQCITLGLAACVRTLIFGTRRKFDGWAAVSGGAKTDRQILMDSGK